MVATPIGNLQDITFRALETLKIVDIIACEDTRRTRKLLTHYGISKKLVSYHEHNEITRADELSEILREGKSVAVVSDAGTPAICDPSFRIVQKAQEIGARIIPIPGAVAFINAVIISGLPTDSIFFGGFLPSKSGERRKRLDEVKDIPATLCFYETPHRLARSLKDCLEIFGNRQAAVVRELTKIHEEILRENLENLLNKISAVNIKGEIVLIVDRNQPVIQESENLNATSVVERIAEIENQGIDRKTALKKAAKEFNLSKSEAYRILLTERNK